MDRTAAVFCDVVDRHWPGVLYFQNVPWIYCIGVNVISYKFTKKLHSLRWFSQTSRMLNITNMQISYVEFDPNFTVNMSNRGTDLLVSKVFIFRYTDYSEAK
jgi:hypothetical protein